MTSAAIAIFFALCIVAISGCSAVPYVELGAGKNMSFTNRAHEWQDRNGVAFIGEVGVEWQHNTKLSTNCKFLHVSQWNVGAPFNDLSESSLDHVGCAARVNIK